MLGLPPSPGLIGTILLGVGLVLGGVILARAIRSFRRRETRRVREALASVCLAATVAATPFVVWRIVEDVRFTSALPADYLAGAGPIDSYLQPYLLDRVDELLPADATYYPAVTDRGLRDGTRSAFGPLALITLFPRRAVSDPLAADWIVGWGVDVADLAPVEDVTVVRKAEGEYPQLVIARVTG